MTPRVDLISIGGDRSAWPLGSVHSAIATPESLRQALSVRATEGASDAVLLWDDRLPRPDTGLVEALLAGRGDCWSAGLTLGTAGQPQVLVPVRPTGMLSVDPDLGVVATSWRVSLQAALLRWEVIDRHGMPDARYRTLTGAGLAFGLRILRGGAVPLHVPALLGAPVTSTAPERFTVDPPTPEDGVRLVAEHFGHRWALWGLLRSLRRGWLPPGAVPGALRAVRASPAPRPDPAPPGPAPRNPVPDAVPDAVPEAEPATVSVILPTVDRYAWLRPLLGQLARQTVPPHEVIVVDQTRPQARDRTLAQAAPGLDVVVLDQEHAGQCSSRNRAIERSTGTHLLFLDDDDEIPPDLIERHLRHLRATDADVSCGAVDEVGAPAGAGTGRRAGVSAELPTNNALLRRDVLAATGLFDLAFEHGARADADLGMRLYRSGALLLIDPTIRVLHHRAPRGGLRLHGARVVTRTSARSSATTRHLRSVTEQYLTLRYCSPDQVREDQVLCALSTLSREGTAGQRLARALVGLVLLPDTMRRLRATRRQATALLADYPQIPPGPSPSTPR